MSLLKEQAQNITAATQETSLFGETHCWDGKVRDCLKTPLACNSAYRPMDVVTSKTSDVGAQAVPDEVDILKLEERVLLQGRRKNKR